MKQDTHHFTSTAHMLQYLKAAKVLSTEQYSQSTTMRDWQKSNSWDHACQLLEQGTEYTKLLINSKFELEATTTDLRPSNNMYYDVTGDALDMGKHLTGHPESWMNFYPEQTKPPKFVKMLVHMGAPGSTDAAAIIARGAAIANMVDILEEYGVRVELTAISNSQCKDGLITTFTTIKREEDALNLNVLASVMHPIFLRRFVFRLIECSQLGYRSANTGGYGYSKDIEKADINGAYYFPVIDPSSTPRSFDKHYVKAQLEKIATHISTASNEI